MARSTPPVRFIKPSSIQIGDTIRVVEQWADAEITKVGTVAKRERENYGTDYLTDRGIVLHTETNDGLRKTTITLLNRPVNVHEIRTDVLF